MVGGEHEWAGRRYRYDPDPYGRWIMGANLLPMLEGAEFGSLADRSQAAEALHLEDGDPVWVESALNRVQATVRVSPGLWPNAIYLPPGLGHHTRVRWGRKSDANMIVGCNPNTLIEMTSEPLTGLAVAGPTRVRIVAA